MLFSIVIIPSKKFMNQISGVIEAVNALALGKATVLLGGGRQLPGDEIEPAAGIKLFRTKGDKVSILRKC